MDRGTDVKLIKDTIDPVFIETCHKLEYGKFHLHGCYPHDKYPGNAVMTFNSSKRDPKLDEACETFREFAWMYRNHFEDDCEVKNHLYDYNDHYSNHYVICDLNYNYDSGLYRLYTTMTYNRWCQMMDIIEAYEKREKESKKRVREDENTEGSNKRSKK